MSVLRYMGIIRPKINTRVMDIVVDHSNQIPWKLLVSLL